MRNGRSEAAGSVPAPCRGAIRLLILAALALLLTISATAADRFLRSGSQARSAAAWMQALELTGPALWAAGTPRRHPETVHPAVDLRFAAGLGSPPP